MKDERAMRVGVCAVFLAVALLPLLLSAPAFGQSTAASLGGTVMDASQAVLPGASITAVNTATGVETKATANNSGIYNFPSLPPGVYNVTAEQGGFQKAVTTDVRLGAGAQARLNFNMVVAGSSETVEVTASAESLLTDAGSSTGTVLQQELVAEIPMLSNNVMELINMMSGVVQTGDPVFGTTSFAGLGSGQVNVVRDGMSVNEVRFGTGVNASANVNTEMVEEFKMILSPVDAEMGRGAGQVQMTTKSGSGAFHGSAVWNAQNTVLDAREFQAKRNNTPPNWRNLNDYTLTASGPVVKNRTFFFVTWEQQIAREKVQTNTKVLTPCARKGIYRYLKGWVPDARNGDNTANFTTYTRPSVNADGTPLVGRTTVINSQSLQETTVGEDNNLRFESVFGELLPSVRAMLSDPNNPGSAYGDCSVLDSSVFNPSAGKLGVVGDGGALGVNPTSMWSNMASGGAYRYAYDPTGFVDRFTNGVDYSAGRVQMPPVNNYDMGDGLNYAGHRWVNVLRGNGSLYGTGGDPERKSITFKIDHNINNDHRVSGTYTWEKYHVADSYKQWPTEYGGYEGGIDRIPQNLMLSLTSTLRPTLLNEFRFGLSRSNSLTKTPLDSADGDKMRDVLYALLPSGADSSPFANFVNTAFQDQLMILGVGEAPLLFHTDPQSGTNPSHPFGTRGNISATWGGVDPRWTATDTITWMKGAHSFKGGFDYRWQSSTQEFSGNRGFAGTGSLVAQPAVFGGLVTGAAQRRRNALGSATAAGNSWIDLAPNSQDTVSGALAGNYSVAYALMTYFSGSLNQMRQYFYAVPDASSPTGARWNDAYAGENLYDYTMSNQEFSFFFKDDWKLTSDLTLNLGVRYEYYGVPHTAGGRTLALKGGSSKIFGISGGGFKEWMTDRESVYAYSNAGAAPPDPVSVYQYVGPDSPNPDVMAWNRDLNNFAPHVGFSWQLPWFGKGKTTLRGGYSVSYTPANNFDQFGIQIADVGAAGVSYMESYSGVGSTLTPGDTRYYMDITDLPRILPMTVASSVQPMSPKSIGAFNGTATVVDENIRNPYVHNVNLSLTRNIANNLTVDVRYVGTLGRDLITTTSLNAPNYIANNLYSELNIVRNGGASLLIDSLIPAGALWPGALTGSQQLRASSATSANLARANFSGVATTLATTNGQLTATDSATAGLVSRAGCLPEDRAIPGNIATPCTRNTPWNYLYVNPQFSYAGIVRNGVLSNYHSMQAQVTMRPTRGLSFQTTYTWSRTLGDSGWTNYMGDRDYYLSGQHRSHTLNSYGTYELPFGPNGFLLRSSSGALKKAVEGWQLSWILSLSSGQPASVTGNSTLWSNSNPILVRPDLWDNKAGKAEWDMETFAAGWYFGRKYTTFALDENICDRGVMDATLFNTYCMNTSTGALRSGAPRVLALASGQLDASGNMLPALYDVDTVGADGKTYRAGTPIVVFRNADSRDPAEFGGNFKPNQLTGQGRITFDVAMAKSIEFMEGKRFEIRVDAQNIFNHPTPSASAATSGARFTTITNASFSINGTNFGYLSTKGGHRTFQAKLRLSF
ncbi:MAG: TonB-dependent receptor [Acidobacteriota bacterium]|jgi:hypothetical protein|nr:TonB-dependent receptor [Acidobacteriota bacterium]